MLVVLPFCAKDRHLALLNLELCKRLDKRANYECIVSCEVGEDHKEVVRSASEYFSKVHLNQYSHCPHGKKYPHAPNWAWQSAVRAVQQVGKLSPWLWWEPDAVPIQSGWLMSIEQAYPKEGNRVFAGTVVRNGVIPVPYLAGVAVYPATVQNIALSAVAATVMPFDLSMALQDHIMDMVVDISNVIYHDFKADGGGWKPGDTIPDVALYHRCKTGELPRKLISELDAGLPVRQPKPSMMNSLKGTQPSDDLNGWTGPLPGYIPTFVEENVSAKEGEKILFVGPAGTSGYGEIVKARLHELSLSGATIMWEPVTVDNSRTEVSAIDTYCNALIRTENYKFDTMWMLLTPENWRRFRESLAATVGTGNRFVGETIWETDRLHPNWVKWMNEADEVVASTQWNKSIFQASGVTVPITVRPYVWPLEPLPVREDCTLKTVSSNDFVFYTIGQWTYRKGITETIRAFCNAFTRKDQVALVVKTFWQLYDKPSMDVCRNRLARILAKYPNPPKVVLSLQHHTRRQMLALHSIGDCYVSLCRSEGLGLGAYDAHAHGRPVIITGWGGQLDFLGFGYPGLVHYDMVPVSGMDWIKAYQPTQHWAEPSMVHAEALMKEAYRKGKLHAV